MTTATSASTSAATASASLSTLSNLARVDVSSKLINEQYKIWKRNTPFLYDFLITHALEWPSLTVEWLPERKTSSQYTSQRLLLGTHTSPDEQNHVLINDVKIPSEDTPVDIRQYIGDDSIGSYSGGLGQYQPPQQKQRSSIGIQPLNNSIEVVQAIAHDGEINRARAMPSQSNIIATKGDSSDVNIYSRSTQPMKPSKLSSNTPDLRLIGHDKDGFGLAWNTKRPEYIVSGSDDKLVCVWDLEGNVSSDGKVINTAAADATTAAGTTDKNVPTLAPIVTFRGHTGVIEDCQWSPHDSNICASGDEFGVLLFWDVRQPNGTSGNHISNNSVHAVDAHRSSANPECNSIAFNPISETIFATGGGDHTVALWDRRNTSERLYSFRDHSDAVLSVSWAPTEWPGASGNILASCSADRRVHVYDVSKIGTQHADPSDAEDGPPELMFIHAGHTDKVADLSLNPYQPWTFASVADDNIVQVWTIGSHIVEANLQ